MIADEIKCPCCGQVTVPTGKVRVDLNENLLYFGERSVPLTPRLAELAHILARVMPNTVHRDVIMGQMWGGCDVVESGLQVAVLQLRRALKPHDLDIINTYGVGYRMVDMSRTERSTRTTFTGAQHAQA